MSIINTSTQLLGGPCKYIIQYIAALSAFLLIMDSGMVQGWPSPSLPRMQPSTNDNCIICITDDESSWLACVNMVGAVVGAAVAAFLGHHLGRKTILIMSGVPYLVSWITIALAETSTPLFVARFIAGMSDGMSYTVVPMYVGEIASPDIRGALGCGISTTWIFGILFINAVGSYANIHVTAHISCAVPLLAMGSMVFMPESPYYLLHRGKTEEARRSLRLFYGTNDVEDDLIRISWAVSSNTKNQGHFLELFTKKVNRKALWVVFLLRTIQQLSGINAVIFYAQNIFKEANDGDVTSQEASIIFFSVQFVVVLICSALIDKTGRRPLLFLSIAGSAVALLVQGTFFLLKDHIYVDTNTFSYVPLIAMVVFIVFFSLGLQGMPILMMGEVFAADVKAFALGLADVYYSIVAIAISKFFKITESEYGLSVPFYSFALCCIGGLVLSVIYTPETKGKTLEDIQELLNGHDKGKDKISNNSVTVLVN